MQYHIKGPFTCDHCDKQFGLQSTLTNHKKTHREKDYVCKVGDCDHRTKSYSGYYEHKKYRHLEDKNFQCDSANANTKHQANYQPIITKCTELSRGDNLKF